MSIGAARETAVRLLRQRETRGQFTEDLLAEELAQGRLSPADRALAQELAYGVVRWQATLDWLIQRKTPQGRTQKAALQILLRLGLYQLFWLERIPDHAAVHETVALARQLGFGQQSGFVNAVLRSYLRERDQTEQLLEGLKTDQPALGYSHPDWLYARWQQRWGQADAIRLLNWNNQPPRTFARVNALRAGADVLGAWRAEKVDYEPVQLDWIEAGLVFELKSHPPLRELSSFRNGLFYIQDPSTLLAVHQLDPQPDETVLDLCAAPGGKTTYIAQRMGNRGRVAALDVNPERLQLVRENCTRLGVSCVEPGLLPERASVGEVTSRFDRVLLDAPCSNTGVLRRRVDLRWRIRVEEIARLQFTQLDLLRRAAIQLHPGGTLVYSTCSLEVEENRATVEAFLHEHADFELQSERELLPFRDGVDGAYVALLRHRGAEV